MQSIHGQRSRAEDKTDAPEAQVPPISPTLKQMNVLEFPNEILFRIFDFVRGSHLEPGYGSTDGNWFSQDADDKPPETRDIQNVRLTCRRFHDASSHLLLDYVYVEMQTASLARLQEISRHPLISKGIRVVDVRLTFYISEMADNLWYIYYCWCRVLFPLWDCVGKGYFETVLRSIDNGNLPFHAFILPIEPLPIGIEDFMKAIRVGQGMYLERYQDQERLLESGLYVQSIADALAQFPSVEVLRFDNHRRKIDRADHVRSLWYPQSVNDPIKTAKVCVRPLNWECYELEYNMPYGVIVGGILGSLADTGTTIRSVVVNLTAWRSFSSLIQSPEVRENLSILAQRLTTVLVRISVMRPKRRLSEDTYDFLSTILGTESLTQISIDLHNFGDEREENQSIGPILNCQRWPNLTHLRLGGVRIHSNELHCLVDSVLANRSSPDQEVDLTFDSVFLLSGTWAPLQEASYMKRNARWAIKDPCGSAYLQEGLAGPDEIEESESDSE